MREVKIVRKAGLGNDHFFMISYIVCIHTIYIILYIVYIGLQNQLTIQHWLSLLQASTRSGWKRTSVKNIWSCFDLFRKKANCAPGREIQVFARNSQDTRPSTESQWQRRAPRARPEPAESPSPLRCLGKNHRNCPSGPPTETFLRKWSTLCKPSVEILDLIKIYEQYKYSLTGFLAQTEIVLSFFLCLNVNLETRKQS